jgi:large repetitive protein
MRLSIPSPVFSGLMAIGLAAIAAGVVFAPPAALAQVTFDGVKVSAIPSGLNVEQAVAVDGSGSLYIANGFGNNVLKEVPAGGSYTQSVVASGLNFPSGVAVDGSGKVYVADTNNNRVLLETPSGATYTQTVLDTGLNSPKRIALDAAGDLFVTGNGGTVYEETLSGGTYTRSTPITGLDNDPTGIAVDGSGNLYITIPSDGTVVLETLSGGSYTQSVLFSGLSSPQGVAVDTAGNVYIADTGNVRILKETLSAGTYTQTILLGGLNEPVDVAVDTGGNLFISDPFAGQIFDLQTGNVSFGTGAVGTPMSTVALPFSIAAGTTVGSVSVLTTGLPNKDYLDAGGSTCTAQTYASATNCVVNVIFSPRSPGARRGAVVLADGSGKALATATLYGTGTGPQEEFFPSTTTVINSTTALPRMIAVDGNSSVFIPDMNAGQIVKVTSAGALSTPVTGLSGPTAVAVDGAGNLYVTNNGTAITMIAPNGTQISVTIAGAANLVGIVAAATGSLYVTDQNTGDVYKVAPNGTQSVFASGFSSTNGLAVDEAGNLYVSDTSGGTISEISPSGVKTTLATGLNEPAGLAVDAAGDVYYALAGSSTIGEIPLGGSPTTLQTYPGGTPLGLAIDSSGNLFFSDTGLATVNRLNRELPPVLSFASTVAGGTSSDSPRIAAMQNTGNASLTIASVVYPIDFTEDAAGSSTNCVAGALASAGVCTFYVDFKPTSAGGTGTTVNLVESIKVTADNYNLPGYLNRINGKGTETKQTSALALSASSLTPVIGSGYTITATASGGGATPTGTVTFYSGGVFLVTGTLNGSGAATITGELPAGLHTITATYGGDTTHTISTAAPLKVTVQKMTTSVSVVSSLSPAPSGASVTFTATMPTTLAGVAPTGTVNFFYAGVLQGQAPIVNGASNTATFTTSGLTATHTMTVVYFGDVHYASVTNSVGVRETITH